ncbi:MAG: hypothetical protein A3I66_19100 [Burkholderiales bacterium RIFCSPLOWO2_02_FULL_57_36]|nr:MAG: hypothetical protein A3I66_19100 [Burkholderiales bacterium RIFCSPLOWO2_02_FULL_57_36]
MVSTTAEPIRLDAGTNTNWHLSAAPVAVLNADSSLHDRLAYCWGLASRVDDITHFLAVHTDQELWRVAMLLESQVAPLLAMLEALAETTIPGRA